MDWTLFLDDIRNPTALLKNWAKGEIIVCRSSKEAIEKVKELGMPQFISFDHDLGDTDTSMVFLKELVQLFPDGKVPSYLIHSNNPNGAKNIDSFLSSWKRSLE